jgi:hypothetical protein
MIYSAYKASKEIAESFEADASRIATRDFNKHRNLMEKKRRIAADLLGNIEKAEHAIIEMESGSRSCGIFAHVSALSLVPLMTFKEGAYSDRQEEARKVSDSKRYNGDNIPNIGGPGNSVRTAKHWGTQISDTLKSLREYGSDFCSGRIKAFELRQKMQIKLIRSGVILTLHFLARTFAIALACTGHMRPQDWYELYCAAVFGYDCVYDNGQQARGSGTRDCESCVHVPGIGTMRDLVWNLRRILKRHSDACIHSDTHQRDPCLSGILCLIHGKQLKKVDKKHRTGYSNDTNPENMYTANMLVDGEWGLMSARNAIVIASGIFDLHDRLALHANTQSITWRNVMEVCGKADEVKKAAEEKKMGGDNYIAETMRETLSVEMPGRCVIKAGLEVYKFTTVGPVKTMPSKDSGVQKYKFDDQATGLIKVKGNINNAWKGVGQSHLREDLESCLEGTSVGARHALAALHREIGHTKRTSDDHYNKPPIAVSFTWPVDKKKKAPEAWEAELQAAIGIPPIKDGENEENMSSKETGRRNIKYVLNLCERVKMTSSTLCNGHLRCGNFGLVTYCECGLAADQFRKQNKRMWLKNIGLEEPPSRLDRLPEPTQRLLDEVDEAFLKLLRGILVLHARWPKITEEQKRYSIIVDKFYESLKKRVLTRLCASFQKNSESSPPPRLQQACLECHAPRCSPLRCMQRGNTTSIRRTKATTMLTKTSGKRRI